MGFACVLQQDQTDCAAAALATVAAHYGVKVGIGRLRDLVGVDLHGTSMLGLIKGAESLGFAAKGAKGDLDALRQIPLPAVLHWRLDDNLGHFVVLHRIKADRAVIADPAKGILKIDRAELEKRWTGYAVLLSPRRLRPDAPSASKADLVLSLLAPHKPALAGAVACALALTVLGLGTSLYLRHLIDHILLRGQTRLLDLASIGMAMILVFRALFGAVRGSFLVDVARKVDLSLISYYTRHVLRLPMRFFETRRVGEILSRVNDAVKIRHAISAAVLGAAVDGLLVVGAGVAMALTDLRLAGACLLFVPAFLATLAVLRRPLARRQRLSMEHSADVEARLVEDVTSVETIKAFGTEPIRAQQAEFKLARLTQTLFSTDRIDLALDALLLVVAGTGMLTALWYGGHRVIEGGLSLGTLLFFYTLVGYLFSPLQNLAAAAMSIQDAAIALDRIWEILALELEARPCPRPPKLKRLRDGVLFEKVTFRYGHRGDVLKELDLFLPAGKTVAVVGESGSGKSTVCKLLARFYEPTEGRITADGLDLRDLPLEAWRRKIGYVGQDPAIFNGTVAENIAFGRPEATQEHIVRATQLAGLEEFVERLPDRYHTLIGERGMNLSGGQRQRLAIARVILCDPEIFVFDEATSHLDTRTERAIQSTLREALRGRTTLMVAHRLSTIKNADLIYVVSEGQVIEWGTHAELLRENGAYWMLWRAQADAAAELSGRDADETLEPIVMVSAPEAQRVRRIPVALHGGAHAHRPA
jgi:ATP-binding cassette, subfamily C, bacteriocin exporter